MKKKQEFCYNKILLEKREFIKSEDKIGVKMKM